MLFWKIYFFAFLLSGLLFLFNELSKLIRQKKTVFKLFARNLMLAPTFIALYLFSFEKELFNKTFWKVYCISISLFIMHRIFSKKMFLTKNSLKKLFLENKIIFLFALATFLPAIFALFLFSFR